MEKISIKALVGGLKWYNLTEYLLVILFAILIPISAQNAMWVMCVIVVNTIVKCIATKHIGNPILKGLGRIGVWLMIAFIGIYLVSLLYSANLEDGFKHMSHRITLAVLGGWFLCSDMSYITPARRRGIFYTLALSTAVLFLVRLGINITDVVKKSGSMARHFGASFDPRHHSYIALYCLVGLSFLYSEFAEHWKNRTWLARVILLLSSGCLITYMVFTNSRAGMLCLILLGVLVSLHMGVLHKKPIRGLEMLVLFTALGFLIHFILPENQRRLTSTVNKTVEFVQSSEDSNSADSTADENSTPKVDPDARIDIWTDALGAIENNAILGVGIGDRDDTLMARYRIRHEKEAVFKHNCHNQFLDTWLSTGIVGLLILLCMMIVPLIEGWKRQDIFMLLFIIMIAVSALFEAILDRMVGLQIFGLCYGMLMLRHENKKEQNNE